jgi:vacuolar-type H+-ATPase subunit I/STV1
VLCLECVEKTHISKKKQLHEIICLKEKKDEMRCPLHNHLYDHFCFQCFIFCCTDCMIINEHNLHKEKVIKLNKTMNKFELVSKEIKDKFYYIINNINDLSDEIMNFSEGEKYTGEEGSYLNYKEKVIIEKYEQLEERMRELKENTKEKIERINKIYMKNKKKKNLSLLKKLEFIKR